MLIGELIGILNRIRLLGRHSATRSSKVAWVAIALVMPSLAAADVPGNSNVYLAVGAAVVTVDERIEDATFSDESFSGNVRLGYLFASFVGAELGYYSLGSLDAAALTLDADAFTAALVVNAPIALFDIYGKLGLARVDATLKTQGPLSATERSGASTEAFYALGGEFDMGPVNLFAEYARINNEFELDSNVFSAGLKFEF